MDDDGLSMDDWKTRIILALAAVTSIPSILASLSLCRLVLLKKVEERHVHDGLLFGISVVDVFSSSRILIFSLLLRPFHEPSRACAMDGFLVTCSFAGPSYNAAISFYFLLVICFDWKEPRLRRVFGVSLHLSIATLWFALAVAGIVLNVYNPVPLKQTCWSSKYPVDCEGSSCIRGQYAGGFALSAGLIPSALIWLSIILNNLFIYVHVRRIIRKSMRYDFRSARSTLNNNTFSIRSQLSNPAAERNDASRTSASSDQATNPLASSRSTISPRPSVKTKASEVHFAPPPRLLQTAPNSFASSSDGSNLASTALTKAPCTHSARIKLVATQSILYVAAYGMCHIWSILLMILPGSFIALNFIEAFFYPLQGVLNILVYIRPTYLRLRQRTDKTRLECLRIALWRRGDV